MDACIVPFGGSFFVYTLLVYFVGIQGFACFF